MKVKILRQQSPVSEPYWQTFSYTGSRDKSVAAMLDDLNYNDDLIDIDGNRADVISWESSCLQGMCGACAMVICGHPALACEDICPMKIPTLASMAKLNRRKKF